MNSNNADEIRKLINVATANTENLNEGIFSDFMSKVKSMFSGENSGKAAILKTAKKMMKEFKKYLNSGTDVIKDNNSFNEYLVKWLENFGFNLEDIKQTNKSLNLNVIQQEKPTAPETKEEPNDDGSHSNFNNALKSLQQNSYIPSLKNYLSESVLLENVGLNDEQLIKFFSALQFIAASNNREPPLVKQALKQHEQEYIKSNPSSNKRSYSGNGGGSSGGGGSYNDSSDDDSPFDENLFFKKLSAIGQDKKTFTAGKTLSKKTWSELDDNNKKDVLAPVGYAFLRSLK